MNANAQIIINNFLRGIGPMPSDQIILANQDYLNWLAREMPPFIDFEGRRRLVILLGHQPRPARPVRPVKPRHDHDSSREFRFKKSRKTKKSARKSRTIKKRKSRSKKH